MKNNKKDYLIKTILFQTLFCLLLFGLLFYLKSSKSDLFINIENLFSARLSENIKKDEIEDAFSTIKGFDYSSFEDNIKTNSNKNDTNKKTPTNKDKANNETEDETEYIPPEEPSIEASIESTGGVDYKISAKNEIPENVSVGSYTLSRNIINPIKNGRVTSTFGERIHPITRELTFHPGIDIATDKNAPIYAAFDGEVIVADYDSFNGNYIKLKHKNNLLTVYCHCERLYVKKGDKIRAGEVIATVGSTGASTGPHLHFELRIDNVSFDPEIALKEAKNAV